MWRMPAPYMEETENTACARANKKLCLLTTGGRRRITAAASSASGLMDSEVMIVSTQTC
eukprot:c15120_g2_i1 orf=1-174(-)